MVGRPGEKEGETDGGERKGGRRRRVERKKRERGIGKEEGRSTGVEGRKKGERKGGRRDEDGDGR